MKLVPDAVKNNLVKTITIVITIFSVLGGVWAIEDRYANKEATIEIAENLQTQQREFQGVQRQFKESQQLVIRQQKTDYLRSRLELYQQMLDQVRYDKNIVIRKLAKDPHNIHLQNERDELNDRERRLKDKIRMVMKELGN